MITGRNYANIDLLIGIILFFSILFPEAIFRIIDPSYYALAGYAFIFLIAGKGFGASVLLIFSMATRPLFSTLGLTGFLDSMMMRFAVFLVSYLEGLLLLVPIGFAAWILGSILFGIPALESFIEGRETAFSVFSDDVFAFGNSMEKIFILSILLTSASFISLFLIKQFNLSLGRLIPGKGKNKKKGTKAYEHALQYIRGKRDSIS
jgi:hypothetical protein